MFELTFHQESIMSKTLTKSCRSVDVVRKGVVAELYNDDVICGFKSEEQLELETFISFPPTLLMQVVTPCSKLAKIFFLKISKDGVIRKGIMRGKFEDEMKSFCGIHAGDAREYIKKNRKRRKSLHPGSLVRCKASVDISKSIFLTLPMLAIQNSSIV